MSFEKFYKRLTARKPHLSIRYTDGTRSFPPRPLHDLLFSPHTGQLEGRPLVDIDTYICPTFLESVVSSQAVHGRNRSAKACVCPVCATVLRTVQVTSASGSAAGSSSSLTQGAYSFRCDFCKWSSREFGITGDKASSLVERLREVESYPLQLQEDEFGKRVAQFAHAFRVHLGEEDESVEVPEDEQAPEAYDEDDRFVPLAGDQAGHVRELEARLERKASHHVHPLPDAPVSNDPKSVPPHLVSHEEFDLHTITSLEQRNARPAVQPMRVQALIPQRQKLLTKLSYRCSKSNKLLVKPRVGPTSVQFDMAHFAMKYVPVATVSRIKRLLPGEPVELVLYLKNPTLADINVKLRVLAQHENHHANRKQTAEVVVPTEEPITIDAYDELAAHEAETMLSPSTSKLKDGDDPAVLAFRQLNKVGIRLTVTPLVAPESTDEVEFGLMMSINSSQPEITEYTNLDLQLHISLGLVDAPASAAPSGDPDGADGADDDDEDGDD